MGNSKSGVEFAIKLDKEFYLPSDLVKGHLFINFKKRYACHRITLEIEGVKACDFYDFQDSPPRGPNG